MREFPDVADEDDEVATEAEENDKRDIGIQVNTLLNIGGIVVPNETNKLLKAALENSKDMRAFIDNFFNFLKVDTDFY